MDARVQKEEASPLAKKLSEFLLSHAKLKIADDSDIPIVLAIHLDQILTEDDKFGARQQLASLLCEGERKEDADQSYISLCFNPGKAQFLASLSEVVKNGPVIVQLINAFQEAANALAIAKAAQRVADQIIAALRGNVQLTQDFRKDLIKFIYDFALNEKKNVEEKHFSSAVDILSVDSAQFNITFQTKIIEFVTPLIRKRQNPFVSLGPTMEAWAKKQRKQLKNQAQTSTSLRVDNLTALLKDKQRKLSLYHCLHRKDIEYLLGQLLSLESKPQLLEDKTPTHVPAQGKNIFVLPCSDHAGNLEGRHVRVQDCLSKFVDHTTAYVPRATETGNHWTCQSYDNGKPSVLWDPCVQGGQIQGYDRWSSGYQTIGKIIFDIYGDRYDTMAITPASKRIKAVICAFKYAGKTSDFGEGSYNPALLRDVLIACFCEVTPGTHLPAWIDPNLIEAVCAASHMQATFQIKYPPVDPDIVKKDPRLALSAQRSERKGTEVEEKKEVVASSPPSSSPSTPSTGFLTSLSPSQPQQDSKNHFEKRRDQLWTQYLKDEKSRNELIDVITNYLETVGKFFEDENIESKNTKTQFNILSQQIEARKKRLTSVEENWLANTLLDKAPRKKELEVEIETLEAQRNALQVFLTSLGQIVVETKQRWDRVKDSIANAKRIYETSQHVEDCDTSVAEELVTGILFLAGTIKTLPSIVQGFTAMHDVFVSDNGFLSKIVAIQKIVYPEQKESEKKATDPKRSLLSVAKGFTSLVSSSAEPADVLAHCEVGKLPPLCNTLHEYVATAFVAKSFFMLHEHKALEKNATSMRAIATRKKEVPAIANKLKQLAKIKNSNRVNDRILSAAMQTLDIFNYEDKQRSKSFFRNPKKISESAGIVNACLDFIENKQSHIPLLKQLADVQLWTEGRSSELRSQVHKSYVKFLDALQDDHPIYHFLACLAEHVRKIRSYWTGVSADHLNQVEALKVAAFHVLENPNNKAAWVYLLKTFREIKNEQLKQDIKNQYISLIKKFEETCVVNDPVTEHANPVMEKLVSYVDDKNNDHKNPDVITYLASSSVLLAPGKKLTPVQCANFIAKLQLRFSFLDQNDKDLLPELKSYVTDELSPFVLDLLNKLTDPNNNNANKQSYFDRLIVFLQCSDKLKQSVDAYVNLMRLIRFDINSPFTHRELLELFIKLNSVGGKREGELLKLETLQPAVMRFAIARLDATFNITENDAKEHPIACAYFLKNFVSQANLKQFVDQNPGIFRLLKNYCLCGVVSENCDVNTLELQNVLGENELPDNITSIFSSLPNLEEKKADPSSTTLLVNKLTSLFEDYFKSKNSANLEFDVNLIFTAHNSVLNKNLLIAYRFISKNLDSADPRAIQWRNQIHLLITIASSEIKKDLEIIRLGLQSSPAIRPSSQQLEKLRARYDLLSDFDQAIFDKDSALKTLKDCKSAITLAENIATTSTHRPEKLQIIIQDLEEKNSKLSASEIATLFDQVCDAEALKTFNSQDIKRDALLKIKEQFSEKAMTCQLLAEAQLRLAQSGLYPADIKFDGSGAGQFAASVVSYLDSKAKPDLIAKVVRVYATYYFTDHDVNNFQQQLCDILQNENFAPDFFEPTQNNCWSTSFSADVYVKTNNTNKIVIDENELLEELQQKLSITSVSPQPLTTTELKHLMFIYYVLMQSPNNDIKNEANLRFEWLGWKQSTLPAPFEEKLPAEASARIPQDAVMAFYKYQLLEIVDRCMHDPFLGLTAPQYTKSWKEILKAIASSNPFEHLALFSELSHHQFPNNVGSTPVKGKALLRMWADLVFRSDALATLEEVKRQTETANRKAQINALQVECKFEDPLTDHDRESAIAYVMSCVYFSSAGLAEFDASQMGVIQTNLTKALAVIFASKQSLREKINTLNRLGSVTVTQGTLGGAISHFIEKIARLDAVLIQNNSLENLTLSQARMNLFDFRSNSPLFMECKDPQEAQAKVAKEEASILVLQLFGQAEDSRAVDERFDTMGSHYLHYSVCGDTNEYFSQETFETLATHSSSKEIKGLAAVGPFLANNSDTGAGMFTSRKAPKPKRSAAFREHCLNAYGLQTISCRLDHLYRDWMMRMLAQLMTVMQSNFQNLILLLPPVPAKTNFDLLELMTRIGADITSILEQVRVGYCGDQLVSLLGSLLQKKNQLQNFKNNDTAPLIDAETKGIETFQGIIAHCQQIILQYRDNFTNHRVVNLLTPDLESIVGLEFLAHYKTIEFLRTVATEVETKLGPVQNTPPLQRNFLEKQHSIAALLTLQEQGNTLQDQPCILWRIREAGIELEAMLQVQKQNKDLAFDKAIIANALQVHVRQLIQHDRYAELEALSSFLDNFEKINPEVARSLQDKVRSVLESRRFLEAITKIIKTINDNRNIDDCENSLSTFDDFVFTCKPTEVGSFSTKMPWASEVLGEIKTVVDEKSVRVKDLAEDKQPTKLSQQDLISLRNKLACACINKRRYDFVKFTLEGFVRELKGEQPLTINISGYILSWKSNFSDERAIEIFELIKREIAKQKTQTPAHLPLHKTLGNLEQSCTQNIEQLLVFACESLQNIRHFKYIDNKVTTHVFPLRDIITQMQQLASMFDSYIANFDSSKVTKQQQDLMKQIWATLNGIKQVLVGKSFVYNDEKPKFGFSVVQVYDTASAMGRCQSQGVVSVEGLEEFCASFARMKSNLKDFQSVNTVGAVSRTPAMTRS